MSKAEEGLPKWQRVVPAIAWKPYGLTVVADRHLPDGTRQHLVREEVPVGCVVANAQVICERCVPTEAFSDQLSHLSTGGN